MNMIIKSKKEGKDQESIQSSITLDRKVTTSQFYLTNIAKRLAK